ncbi:hypothetical protein PFICI_03425 [Pestalotiopsis fici W106-1]|uniref:histidine kinase n=1 Tax=Pestalotiopsis fici (strain W106-1 / CGMCC3.15140) TaxID=1229662 RepID=W3XH89_PESFW|nr:uncharacterized protein PFICI_03425 [Pestalotiopsis fici W106-1]ETS85400.1 hypothetical protein PFICI_03425 [Pestalotiopsis fici W106-1]
MAATKTISEVGRAREMFRYAASQLVGIEYQKHAALIESSSLRTSQDTVLTGLAELIAVRLGAARATISMFDQRWQYVIAEATPRLSLSPSAKSTDRGGLLLCGTAVPRSQSICSQVVTRHLGDSLVQGAQDLSVFIVGDVLPRLEENPYFNHWPHPFYAAVPIQTPRGIDIGVLTVYGNQANAELDEIDVSFMQDVSRTIMEYLGAVRAREGHRRANRMVRGVGSFVEGEASLSGWKDGTNVESFLNDAKLSEGALNAKQQGIQKQQLGIGKLNSDATIDDKETELVSPISMPDRDQSPTDNEMDSELALAQHTFSKAANILRESMEIEGVLFLDAAISSFGGGVRRGDGRHGSSSSSSDDSQNSTSRKDADTPASALAFSNSSDSSIDGTSQLQGRSPITERLLAKFIKHYPQGHTFNFDENGTVSSSESASEESAGTARGSLHLAHQGTSGRSRSNLPKRGGVFKKTGAADSVAQLFPGARSVAFIPVWDSHKHRWFAGGFIYTKSASRTFTTEGELSYVAAFSSIIMAEVHRRRAISTDKSKSDLLGSLSHELRSPLHGVVLGAELLQDTELDIFQKDVLNSMESCCRTLVDTIDHLLDWTKINKFRQHSAAENKSGKGPRRRGTSDGVNMSIETGMMTTTSEVNIAAVAEQVVESIFAGHTFQVMSVRRMAEDSGTTDVMTRAIRAHDGLEALEIMKSGSGEGSEFQVPLGGVILILSIDPNLPWTFITQPGALRRILMNLLGNSLRFTKQGFVEVHLRQEPPSTSRPNSRRLVVVTVTDSGRGIGHEFLQHQLFKPFTQEDTLGAGAGLGLSLVKNIVTSLRGSINAKSKPSEGCTMTVKLPLQTASPSEKDAMNDEAQAQFAADIAELQGLRVSIVGYPSASDQSLKATIKDGLLRERSTLMEVCKDWLRMRVIEPHEATKLIPDLILCGERFIEPGITELREGDITPTVIICRNALMARSMATSPKYSIRAGNGVLDFISQPVGPRKLAKVLLQCFKQWTKLQETAMSTQAPSDMNYSESANSPMEEPRDILFAQSTRSAPETSDTSADSSRPRSSAETQRQVVEESISPLRDPIDLDRDRHAETPQPDQTAIAPNTNTTEHGVGEEGKSQNLEIRLKQSHKARYLLVEDNAINMKILIAYMRKLGHRYDTANNGQEALEAFQKGAGQYKCILMDISMPVMDGFESSRRIRAHEKENGFARCKIYALTGLASESAQQEAFSSGIDLCLAKPVKLKELSGILDERRPSD